MGHTNSSPKECKATGGKLIPPYFAFHAYTAGGSPLIPQRRSGWPTFSGLVFEKVGHSSLRLPLSSLRSYPPVFPTTYPLRSNDIQTIH